MIVMPLNFRGRSRAFDPHLLIVRFLFLNLVIELGRMTGNDFSGLHLKRKIPLKEN